MNMPHDFPPVPKCFSHLLTLHRVSVNEHNEDQLSQSLPLNFKIHEHFNNSYVRSFSESSQNSLHSTGYCVNGPFFQEGFADEDQDHVTVTAQSRDVYRANDNSAFLSLSNSQKSKAFRLHKDKPKLTKQSSIDESKDDEGCQPDKMNPFIKLNSSLERLQHEMKELRLFDVSLFCQLLSLHEAIQDLKFNIGDRYDTGSEYSLGSASYMGSMSSLDEESDWSESQVFMHSPRGEDDENRQSTSSLLEQITALTQRAEEDV